VARHLFAARGQLQDPAPGYGPLPPCAAPAPGGTRGAISARVIVSPLLVVVVVVVVLLIVVLVLVVLVLLTVATAAAVVFFAVLVVGVNALVVGVLCSSLLQHPRCHAVTVEVATVQLTQEAN
jgi:hypothetical protein